MSRYFVEVRSRRLWWADCESRIDRGGMYSRLASLSGLVALK